MAIPSQEPTAVSPLPGRTWIWVSVLLVAWALPGLFGHDPWKPDEAAAIGVIWNLLQGGSWISLQLAGESLPNAAPLTYWWCGFFAWLFDGFMTPHHGARLGAAVMASATIALFLRGVTRLCGREALLPALLLLIGCLGFIPEAHHVSPDMAVFLGYCIALNGLAESRAESSGYWLGAGVGVVFLGGGSLHAALLGLSVIALPLASRDWRHVALVPVALRALAALAPFVLIWPLLLYRDSPEALGTWLSWKDHLRSLSSAGVMAAVYNQLRLLSWFSAPAWPIALWALWRGRRSLSEDRVIPLALVMFIGLFVLMLFDRVTGESHRLALLVPIVILATQGLPLVRRGGANGLLWFSVLFFFLFALAAWFYWMALDIGFPARLHAHLTRMQPGYEVRWLAPRVLVALACTVGWVWVIVKMRRCPERPILAWTTGATLVWALAFTLFNNYLDAGRSYRSFVYEVRAALPNDHGCVASEGLGVNQRAMLHYFGGLVTERMENPVARRGCNHLLVQTTRGQSKDPGDEWQRLFSGARPGDKKELYQLFARKR